MVPEISVLPDLLDDCARKWPENKAISRYGEHGEECSYGALQRSSERLAGWLGSAGIARGDRVVIASTMPTMVAALAFAVARAGAAFSVLHEQVRGAPLGHVLRDCQPRLLVGDDDDVLGAARGHGVRAAATTDLARYLRDDGPGEQPFPAADRVPLPVDPVCLIYTSGTTALPKAVVSTHQQVVFAVRAIASVLRYRADDIVYCPVPLSFDYGLYQVFLGAASGAHIVAADSVSSGPTLLRSLLETHATVLPAVPSVAESLAWLLKRSPGQVPALRLITNTGAALSGSTLSALRAAIPGMSAQVMYGLTECKRASIMPPDGDLDHPGSCGLALPGTEIFAIDADENRLPPGAEGELVVRGPNVMAGYWRRPELTEQKFPRRDGLFAELRTGDYGKVDKEGYVYFSGRRDDQYKERGFRISAVEVEAAAHRVPGVASAAVLLPSGGAPATLVVVGDTAPEQVLEQMRDEIEAYKIPRRCLVLDQLPLNQNGKVDRRVLASLISTRGT
jgi:acyl-CoA synthetase (AMP-forming)/AMP-acid ligase II